MRRTLCILLCLFGAIGSAQCDPGWTLDESPLSAYSALFDTLLGHHYAAAESICTGLDSTWPGHPGTEYAWASLIYAKLCDFEDTLGTAELETRAERCLAECEEWQDRASDSLAALREYLVGAAYSVSGLTRHRQGKTVDGVRRLLTSRKHFDRAIRIEPEFYDAYVGRGAYRYAAANSLSLIRWMPGVPSKRAGWADLTLALERAKFSRFAALSSMVWLALQDEHWATADSMVKAGLARFPGSRTFLSPKLALEKRTERWAEARRTARELLDSFQSLEQQNGYEVIGLYRNMMDFSDMLGEQTAALEFARAGLAVQATPYALERRVATLEAMRTRLERGVQE